MHEVLVAAGDAGGARALVSVIRGLRTRRVRARCYAYGPAVKIWAQAGIPLHTTARMSKQNTSFLLTGTSFLPERRELALINLARKIGIPSMTVLDAWINYRERFLNRRDELILPDTIAVMDRRAKQEMITEGFPARKIRITGHPGFEGLRRYASAKETEKSRRAVRDFCTASPNETVVFFVNQPLMKFGSDKKLGYNEVEVWNDLQEALGKIAVKTLKKYVLINCLHPRQENDHLLAHRFPGVRTCVLQPGILDSRIGVNGSDLTVGMNSSLLVEAALLKKSAISYQPGLTGPDPLPTNSRGWTREVYRKRDLESAVAEELHDPETICERKRVLGSVRSPRGAVNRIISTLTASRRRVD